MFAAAVAGANVLLDANYMFLCRPPDAPSPFFFLPWPWYIVFLEGVGVVFVVLAYLPLPLSARLSRRKK
ncbi:MAG: hypothetical protein SVT52_06725 [Planctomycetota bacterium]|nr:hypothetical protein [Planctomycetota bacterium]